MKVQEPDAEKSVRKWRKRREQVLESKEASKLQVMLVFLIKELSLSSNCLFLRWPLVNVNVEQKIISRMKRLLLFVFILVILLAATYYGYKGLLWLNDWMNEVDERRQRYSRIKWLFISLIAPFIHHFFYQSDYIIFLPCQWGYIVHLIQYGLMVSLFFRRLGNHCII